MAHLFGIKLMYFFQRRTENIVFIAVDKTAAAEIRTAEKDGVISRDRVKIQREINIESELFRQIGQLL